MSQHDSPLNQQMLGMMGGGNGGLDAAYGQLAASMAAEDRRMQEFNRRFSAREKRQTAPARPMDAETDRRFMIAYRRLALFALILFCASQYFGFRVMWGFCAMLAIETMVGLGGDPTTVWPWGKWIGLLLLLGAGVLVTFLTVRLTKFTVRMIRAAAAGLWELIVLGFQAIGGALSRLLVTVVRGLWVGITRRRI